ncbi:hydroxymethylglutaryl-CoA synthase 1-like [Dysidea avara]|uniref:hydroxymethylglutaryl-CoA synthase 1-like n=1 Tax=Dysidea avara TaxID=196820 RepID=UPI00332F7443
MSATIPSIAAGKWPERVGIIAIEAYVPSSCIKQADLEVHDGVPGKYTIGLGQQTMGFCGDNEDVNSLSMTVLQALMEKNKVSYKDIGRLEVGTETVIDKSKSVKTFLMQLFAQHGNTNVDGLETRNACYGGTQALFNSVAWVESSAWDGRFAVVIAADIAIYAEGNARPTGGAGAIAMLIGPNAPLYMEQGLRSIHMEHVYDFYKPDLCSEYPVVHGKLSLQCYLSAMDTCYERYKQEFNKRTTDRPFTIEEADWYAFHSPLCKLVQKGFARLMLNDYVTGDFTKSKTPSLWNGLDAYKDKKMTDTYFDKETEKTFLKASGPVYEKRVVPTILVAQQNGNMYTASVYGGVVSLLAQKTVDDLAGTRIVLFSYGSGLASSMFSLKFDTDKSPDSSLTALVRGASSLLHTLETRKCYSPAEFEATLSLREHAQLKAPYKPKSGHQDLFPGTFYLTNVDDAHRRTYERHAVPSEVNRKVPLVAPIRLVNPISNGVGNGH